MDILTYEGFDFYLPGVRKRLRSPLFIDTSRIMNVSSGPHQGAGTIILRSILSSDLPCHFQASLPFFIARKNFPLNNSSTIFFSTEGISFILVHKISGPSSPEASQVFCICVIDPYRATVTHCIQSSSSSSPFLVSLLECAVHDGFHPSYKLFRTPSHRLLAQFPMLG